VIWLRATEAVQSTDTSVPALGRHAGAGLAALLL
jgi:hypothetical protein